MTPDCPRGRPSRLRRIALHAALCAALACSSQDDAQPRLTVSAASSLTDVVTRLARDYEAAGAGVAVVTNFGSSGTLLQQIRQGATVDLFLPAAEREMTLAIEEGLADGSTERVLASNALVLVVPEDGDGVASFADLAGERVRRVAIGAPASVPAGAYAREMLRGAGLWEAIEPRIVYTTNVRQALTYVERGEVDAALVYRTDALRARRSRVMATAAPGTHAPIRYPAAVLTASRHTAEARRFLAYLASPAGAAVFAEHGFGPAPPPAGGE